MTYKKWRETHNPWTDGSGTVKFFIGNLNPTTDANLIEAIHSLIDEFFNPRYIGVYDPERFTILFYKRLNEIEYNFYQALTSDRNYTTLQLMLKDLDVTTTGNENDNNSRETDFTRTDNLMNSSNRTQNPYNVTNELTYNNVKDTGTQSGTDTQNGTLESTDANTAFGRVLQSDTPQSNVASTTTGIDTPITWTYATGLNDTYNKSNNTSNQTNTSTNQNETTTENTRTGSQTQTTDTGTVTSNETGTNTGTVKNAGTDTITGVKTTAHENTGRNNNLAIILDEWKNFLYRQASAYQWLIEKLETCFITSYDEDSEEQGTV